MGRSGGEGAIFSSSKSKRKANGCMAAFHHLFDFQHFYFHSHHHLTNDSPSRSTGLKLIEECLPSTTYKDKQSLNIPVSMRVRTEIGTKSSRLSALVADSSTSSSEICNSAGSKTPNLVARLMGLDLLPDKTDSLSNLHAMSSHHGSSRLTNHTLSNNGTRSLPVSPRISSARKSDFDIHRLSLQLNKENKHEEYRCSRLKQDQEENRSPRDHARQIVKQIKERVVTRRVVGMDITNSVKNRETRPLDELRRDRTVSCSPRTRFLDKENKPSTTRKPNSSSSFRPEQIIQKPNPTTVILVPISKASGEKQSQNRVKQRQLKLINRCSKAESETRFTTQRLLIKPTSPTSDIRIKQRETISSESRDVKAKPSHKKKFKKTPNSNVLENISATRPPQKQINERDRPKSNEDASVCSSLIHKNKNNSPQVATEIDSEKDYITRRLNNHGTELISKLCSTVARYSSKCCQVPGELALVDVDHLLEKKKVKEEGEEIIAEIEREIINALVHETASELRRIKTA